MAVASAPSAHLRPPPRRAPLPIRILTSILPVLGGLLLATTIFLFHLHHAHHDPEDDASDVRHAYGRDRSGADGVGGSALRHKLDLADFLLRKYDEGKDERARVEAGAMGWKGGSEEAFVEMIREAEAEGRASVEEKPGPGNARPGAGADGKRRKKKGKGGTSPPKDMAELLHLVQSHSLDEPAPPPRDRTARGFSGLAVAPPAMEGALRGALQCPGFNDDNYADIGAALSSTMAYWNEPRGARDNEEGSSPWSDRQKAHPFVPPPVRTDEEERARRRYLTFEPDTGGFNNLRMSLENMIVLAAATGRTLVIPPEQTMYLIEAKKGEKRKSRSYLDFFNLTHNNSLLRRVPIISSSEFLAREGGLNGAIPLTRYNETYREHLSIVAAGCEERKKSDVFCEHFYDHVRDHGLLAPLSAEPPHENCFIFDETAFEHGNVSFTMLPKDVRQRISKFCNNREPLFYSKDMHDAPVWHFETMDFRYRLLIHYYALIFFTDPRVGNYYKRFVRDFIRYHDQVHCTAGKIVLALQEEGRQRGQLVDDEGAGGYSSLHVRRGDLQFREVKFDSMTWYNNTREIWLPREVLYVATDERQKSFFDDLAKHHDLRFLDDYKKLAGLDDVDQTLYGMIDTAVASRGRVFAGTWFSTFSGYIIRLRGYHGMSKFSSYYSYLPRKYHMHEWTDVGPSYYAREYPTGWVGIDGDEFVEDDSEGKSNPYEFVDEGESDPYVAEAAKTHPSGDLARGISGLPMSLTPALEGASRAHIQCDTDVDALTYWNDPQGHRDYSFETPFVDTNGGKSKYMAFELDVGGFNNVRMSFEIVFVMAAAMGRTLVLPPDQAMYRLRADKRKERGLRDFFPIHSESFLKRANVITMEEFVKLEGRSGGQFPVPSGKFDELLKSSKTCSKKGTCLDIYNYISSNGVVPNITASHQCFVFDWGMYANGIPENDQSAKKFCGSGKRKMVYLTKKMQEPQLLFIKAGTKGNRMLSHFYGYLHFTDTSISNYFKRYVRDLLHYSDVIFCAAGKIVAALQVIAKENGFALDAEVGGGYSALHLRRGELQYKKSIITADEWYANTKDVWKEGEILYIATDEKDKSFFDPFRANHTLFFLNDFQDLVGLDKMDPNHMGMIETLVASRGRAFAGTFFSTFSGYINRLRGYYGMSMKNSWYGSLDRKHIMQSWHTVNLDTYAKEWPDGWIGIDGDKLPSEDFF